MVNYSNDAGILQQLTAELTDRFRQIQTDFPFVEKDSVFE